MKLLFTAFVIFASLAIGNPTVSIIDYGTGSSTVMTPGDAFAVNIYGGTAYGAVTVLVNGSWLGNEGNADVNGHFVFSSTVPNNPGEVDDQIWSISGVPATPNPLHFTIGNAIPMSGTLSASPNPCSVPAGSNICTTTISWSSQGNFISSNMGVDGRCG